MSPAANDARGRFLLHFTAESNLLLSDFPLIYSALHQKDVSLSLFSLRLFLFCRSDGAGGRTRGKRRTVRATELNLERRETSEERKRREDTKSSAVRLRQLRLTECVYRH